MKIELSGVLNKENNFFIKINKINQKKYVNNIFQKKASNMLDWLDLTNLDDDKILEIENYATMVRKKFKNLVVLGIGGSALGIKMINDAFFSSINKQNKIKTFVCDNIDSDSFLSFISTLDLKKTIFNVITKSGKTSETLAQMSIILNLLIKKKIKVCENVFVTTTKDNELYTFAISNNINVFTIPQGVGGRFSVLSNVGLVPCAIMGLDIKKLLYGANLVRENSKKLDETNLAYLCATINYKCLKKGFTNLVIMPYSDRLRFASEYFAQLWAESLGKKFDLDGSEVFAGQNPIKALGVTDQHSQLQLYSEGPKDKVFMFLKVDKCLNDTKLRPNFKFAKHLNDISLFDLFNAEFYSTQFSLTSLNRPNYTIYLDNINEENMGALIFFMQMMTAFMGQMMNVNAYDQNGVELSKIYTRAFFDKNNMPNESKQINDFIKNRKFIEL